LLNEQQIGELLSDLIIDCFVLHCSLSRISQILDHHRYPAILVALARVLMTDKMEEILKKSFLIQKGITLEKDKKTISNFIRQCEKNMHLPYNLFKLKREIVQTVLKEQRYPFELNPL